MSTTPVLVRPRSHQRSRDVRQILELLVLVALEVVGTTFVSKVFTKPVKLGLKRRETAESLKEKITLVKASLNDTVLQYLLHMPFPDSELKYELDALLWDAADLLKDIEEVEKWGRVARFIRARDMKIFARSAKAAMEDLRCRLNNIQHDVTFEMQSRIREEMREEIREGFARMRDHED